MKNQTWIVIMDLELIKLSVIVEGSGLISSMNLGLFDSLAKHQALMRRMLSVG